MPPVSEAQRRFMRAAANNPKMRKRAGVDKKVADDFNKSDPGGSLPEKKPGKSRMEKRGYKNG